MDTVQHAHLFNSRSQGYSSLNKKVRTYMQDDIATDSILSVIIVNYNTGKQLLECVRSLFDNSHDMSIELIIIDNASSDGSIEKVREEFSNVEYICNSKNLGFAAANNQGFKVAHGRNILLLNPDTIVKTKAIQNSLVFLNSIPDAGIVGCRLMNSNGTPQPSCRTFPTAWDYLFDSLFLTKLFPRSRVFGRFFCTNTEFTKPTEVDVVQGAFFLIKRRLLDEIGPLDERFFIYAEERDFCYRAKRAGWKVFFFPYAEIIHLGEMSTRPRSEEMFIELNKSTIQFHKKHDPASKVKQIEVILFVGLVVRFIIWTIISMLNRSVRAKSKRHIYASTAKWFCRRILLGS